MRLQTIVCATVIAAACNTSAFAQSTAKTASEQADALFTEAAVAAEEGRYADACPMLEKSLALDPAIGTEFNLADCHEHVGRLASAWIHYRSVEKNAHIAGKSERESAAHARLVVLEPKLGWVKLVPAPGSAVGRLEVDGNAVSLTADSPRGTPLDPGARRLTVTSTAQEVFTETVTAIAGKSVSVRVFAERKPELFPPTQEPARGNAQRSLAIALGAGGVVGLAVGGVTGIASIIGNSDAKKLGLEYGCDKPQNPCRNTDTSTGDPKDAAAAWTKATTFGTVSTIGFVVGGVSAAAAIVLWVTAPKRASSTRNAGVHWDLQGVHF